MVRNQHFALGIAVALGLLFPFAEAQNNLNLGKNILKKPSQNRRELTPEIKERLLAAHNR